VVQWRWRGGFARTRRRLRPACRSCVRGSAERSRV